MKTSTSWPCVSRKYSAIVTPVSATRARTPGRLVHLAEDERRLVDDAGLLHLVPHVVAFAGAFAHAGEDGEAAVLGGDVADQLLDDDGLAGAGAAVGADLAALRERRHEVEHLDAGLEDLRRRLALLERRRRAVDGPVLVRLDLAEVVDGSPRTLKSRPRQGSPTGTEIGAPVSTATAPRRRPSVVSIARQRTQLFPRCCWTSTISFGAAGSDVDLDGVVDVRQMRPPGTRCPPRYR